MPIHEIKVQILDEDNYRKLIASFDKEEKKDYTYQLRSFEGITVVQKEIKD